MKASRESNTVSSFLCGPRYWEVAHCGVDVVRHLPFHAVQDIPIADDCEKRDVGSRWHNGSSEAEVLDDTR